jgi:putative transposase
MKRVAGRQTRFVNQMEKRSGSLWEGRYKSSPINASEYLLACCRYVELNPLRAGMVGDPTQYRWSSCSAKVGIIIQTWLDFDPFYLGLGISTIQRAEKYATWLRESVSESE